MTQLATETRSPANRRSGFTMLELEHHLEEIQDQIEHWKEVHEGADESVKALEKREATANEIISEIEAGATPVISGGRQAANDTLDAVGWRLKNDRRRRENATTQLKAWQQRLKEFPHEELKTLRLEQARRERLRF